VLRADNLVGYETFERGFIRTGDPGITVRPDGRFFFNAAASLLMKRSGIKTVIIRWDSEKKKVAFQACHKNDKNAYSISFPAGSRSPSLTAKSFIRHIEWSADGRQRIAVTWDEKHKMFEATLPSQFVGKRKGRVKLEADGGR
jgi:hypothetical protein